MVYLKAKGDVVQGSHECICFEEVVLEILNRYFSVSLLYIAIIEVFDVSFLYMWMYVCNSALDLILKLYLRLDNCKEKLDEIEQWEKKPRRWQISYLA